MAPERDVDRAHRHGIRNRAEIEGSELCGCFYCLRTFAPGEIERWLAVEETAICPYCQIDSVLGSASGFPITDDFLRRMRARWFETIVPFPPEEPGES
jgi:hypothetical protein